MHSASDLPRPLFSSGQFVSNSYPHVHREIRIGSMALGGEVCCYQVDELATSQQLTHLTDNGGAEALAEAYERACQRALDEGYKPIDDEVVHLDAVTIARAIEGTSEPPPVKTQPEPSSADSILYD